ncbi:hypothetical protein IscW_ISCW014324 [Ixodes scapularis]|uniref:Uncharacterized protein n=1 Tax=Ixodes scapularis TaxID=6945 RepID=B7QHC3_IXOSC|nr:hypothetical protein IscW_ISCW014324 [Ixodes scapularis]|eukprot:XP_002414580.1 hypothetical protein IscW_ISCW014324 [Ixodes scapularis]
MTSIMSICLHPSSSRYFVCVNTSILSISKYVSIERSIAREVKTTIKQSVYSKNFRKSHTFASIEPNDLEWLLPVYSHCCANCTLQLNRNVKMAQALRRKARLMFPLCFALFNIVYWPFYTLRSYVE